MESQEQPVKPSRKNSRNVLLAVMVGQVGFITLLIILAAVLGGLALDRQLGTRPWFTIGLLIASVPVSIVLMILVARKTVARIKTESAQTPDTKEEKIAKDS